LERARKSLLGEVLAPLTGNGLKSFVGSRGITSTRPSSRCRLRSKSYFWWHWSDTSKSPCQVNVSPSFSHPLLELHQIQALDVRHWQWKRQVADDRGCLKSFEDWVFQGILRQGSSNSSEAEPQTNCHDTHHREERYCDEPVAQIPGQAVWWVRVCPFGCWPEPAINRCDGQKDRIKINTRIFGQLA